MHLNLIGCYTVDMKNRVWQVIISLWKMKLGGRGGGSFFPFPWGTRAGGHKKGGTTVFVIILSFISHNRKGRERERESYQLVSFSFWEGWWWHELPWIFLQPFNDLTQQQSSCPHPSSLWPSITIIITPSSPPRPLSETSSSSSSQPTKLLMMMMIFTFTITTSTTTQNKHKKKTTKTEKEKLLPPCLCLWESPSLLRQLTYWVSKRV